MLLVEDPKQSQEHDTECHQNQSVLILQVQGGSFG